MKFLKLIIFLLAGVDLYTLGRITTSLRSAITNVWILLLVEALFWFLFWILVIVAEGLK